MGGPNTGGGTSTFGQGTSWVPLTLAALGGGLAGAGRQGSPASTMGTGLMTSMLGYYANQAATADERARRRQLEDEALQRQKEIDAQQEQYRAWNLLLQGGTHEPGLAPSGPSALEGKFGQQKVYLNPVQRTGMTPYLPIIRSMYGDQAASEAEKASAGLPEKAIAPFLQTWMPAYQQQYERKQNAAFGDTLSQLSRPQIGMGTGQGGTMSDTPELGAPVIPPVIAQALKASLGIPDARKEALKTFYEKVGEYGTDIGGTVNTTPGQGETASRTIVQEPGKRPRVQTTISPENPQRALDTKETEVTVAEGTRLEKSPGYKALYQAADVSGKEALTSWVNGAKQGIVADLQSLRSAMSNTGTSPDSFDKARLEELRRSGRLKEFINNQVDASNPDRVSKEHLVGRIATNINNLEADIAILPSKHPDYPMRAKRLASEYRAIADASPTVWGKRAFQRMAQLLGWNEAQYRAEASQFAAQHGIPLKGGQ